MQDITLESVLTKLFPPIEKIGYLSLLPNELRTESAKFVSSCNYKIEVNHLENYPNIYQLRIIHRSFLMQLIIQPKYVLFIRDNKEYHRGMAVLHFLLYVLELKNIGFENWPIPVNVLQINANYRAQLTTSQKIYTALADLTPGPDLSLELGIYSRINICRELVLALYDIAGKTS